MKIKKGDSVFVITGKDKGKKGSVVKAFPKDSMILIDNVNLKKIHRRPRKQGEKGKIVSIAFPIHVSNVKKSK